MKKFLLSMVALLGFAAVATAADVTLPAEGKKWNDYTWTQSGTDYKGTVDGYSLTLAKGSSTSNLVSPDQYSIRIYAGANLTVTAPEGKTFNKVTVTINATGNKAVAATANSGWTVSAFNNGVFTMTSETPQSTITFDGSGKQLRVASMVLSDGQGGSVDPDPTPDPEPTETIVKSVAEIKALSDGDEFTTDFAFTVGWVKYSNIFVCDEKGDFIQIYGKNTLSQGDVIPAGLKGSYKLFKGTTPEIENATIPEATAGTFVPKVVAASEISTALVNSVVKIEGVELAEATPAAKENFTGKVGDIELSFRNNYEMESVPAGKYDITVVVTIFNDAPSLYVTKYDVATGIADIAVDEAAVEYFNLQGIRISEPAAGEIVIRRQGNKVQKVLVK